MFRARLPLPFASRGYPVLLQSSRGTAGSGGEFRPQIDEQRDGIDTLRWERQQPWFTGRLATVGGNYLGYTQWAVAGRLAKEEPQTAAEAMPLSVTMPDFGAITWDHGVFSLRNALGWSRMMSIIEKPTAILTMIGPDRKLERAFDVVPFAAGDSAVVRRPIPWYQDWLVHEDLDDYRTQQSHTATVADVTAAVIMTTGWYDIFLPWQIHTYEILAEAGRPPLLTIGPWQHASNESVAVNIEETIDFFGQQFHGTPTRRIATVRYFLTGAESWIDADSWPPPGTRPRVLYLQAGGSLTSAEPAAAAGPTRYTYDPSVPTPATGGPQLRGRGGPVDDTEHEKRADVVTFTTAPLDRDSDVASTPSATLWVRSDRPSIDLFVRVCDVDTQGRSMTVTDGIRRVGPPPRRRPTRAAPPTERGRSGSSSGRPRIASRLGTASACRSALEPTHDTPGTPARDASLPRT
jgi:uncharacterized protein